MDTRSEVETIEGICEQVQDIMEKCNRTHEQVIDAINQTLDNQDEDAFMASQNSGTLKSDKEWQHKALEAQKLK